MSLSGSEKPLSEMILYSQTVYMPQSEVTYAEQPIEPRK
jgi:hypothetical protein